MHVQLAVLGGGPGGYAAAFRAADLGMEVVLIDAQPRLGGTCLLHGCIPSKALLHVARLIDEVREVARWGVEYSEPELHLETMRAQKEKVIATLSGGLEQLARQRKVRVLRAQGSFENSTTLRLAATGLDAYDDNSLTFDHCILATGSLPAKVPALDLPSNRITTSRSALDVPDVPHSLLVVGGGYVGLEMGTIYAQLGSKVSVVEMTDGLLPGADRDLVKPLHHRLDHLFAAVHLGTRASAVTEQSDSLAVTLDGPNGSRTESYSRILVAVGRRPRTEDIGLENTRVELDQQGFVRIDRQQRTSDPYILAVGDVAGEPMLAHKALHQGKVAAEVACGQSSEFRAVAVPAVVFTDPEVAWAGCTETAARRDGRKLQTTRYPWAVSGRAQALGRTEGLTKILVDPDTRRVVGMGIVGPGAGELIAEGVLAIETGSTVDDLARAIHTHPTLSETVGGAAELHLGLATEIYRPGRRKLS